MAFWWAWTRWQKNKPDRILGTTNHTNLHEKVEPPIPPIDTDKNKQAGARLAGQAGAAFSNLSASQLARDSEKTSLIRSADTPSSSPATSHPLLATAPEALALDPRPSPLDSAPPSPSPIGDQRRWGLFWIFAAVALLSLGISVWGVKAQPFATFFLLPTRAWELLLGSLLAVLPAAVVVRSVAQREILCVVGLAGIFLPVFLYGEQTPFPGLTALPPCLGTAALIWANAPARCDSQRGWSASVLSWPPMVFVGLISYSLYLWHWPIFAYGEYLRLLPAAVGPKMAVVLLAIALSVVSWRFVEMPFRKIRKPAFQRIFSSAVLASMALMCGGWFFIQSEGGLRRFSGEALAAIQNLKKSKESPENFHVLERSPDADQIQSGNIPRFGNQDNGGRLDLLVWGDSHAAAVAQLLHEEFAKQELGGEIVFNLSTPPIQNFEGHLRLGLPRQKRDEVAEAVFDRIKEKGVRNVLLAGYWAEYQSLVGGRSLRESLAQTIEAIQSLGANVWVALDWPDQKADPNRVLVVSRLPEFVPRIPATTLSEYQNANSGVLELRYKLPQVHFLDLAKPLLDSQSQTYPFIKEGHLVYQDANHLSPFAMRAYLTSALQPLVENLEETTTTSIHSWD